MAYYEVFKGTLTPQWTVSDRGITFKNTVYPWDQVSNPTVFNDPRTRLTNGVFQVTLGGKPRALAYATKDKARAREALAFIQDKLREQELIRSGVRPERLAEAMRETDRRRNLILFNANAIEDIMAIAGQVIPHSEELYVALKGTFKEYLFCTDKMVYIHKTGFMTGHTFGSGGFKMPYANITNAEVDYHMTTGYFELSSGGLQNRPLNYWNNKGNSPQKAPNAIAITGPVLKGQFEQASRFIMEKAGENRGHPTVVVKGEATLAEQIRDLKALVDEGLLTQEEFDAKKRQLLNI